MSINSVYQIEDRFTSIEAIGSGAYGQVFKARDIRTGAIVAIKQIKKETFSKEGLPYEIIREIRFLRDLDSPYFAHLREVLSDNSLTYYIILDYYPYDMHGIITETAKIGSPLSPTHIKSYIRQILYSIYALHSHRIMHRDIKPANFVLDFSNHVRVTDFGLSKRVFPSSNPNHTANVITAAYRPLEMLLSETRYPYNFSVDIWSLGCSFFEMMCGNRLFTHHPDALPMAAEVISKYGYPLEDEAFWETFPNWQMIKANKEQYLQQKVSFRQYIEDNVEYQYPGATDFLLRILQLNPSKRPTARELIDDPFIDNSDGKLDPSNLEPLGLKDLHSKIAARK